MHAFPILASTLGKIFQPFFNAMAWVLAGFYAVIPNYAIDIALLTIVVMAVTAPLTIKSTRSMAAMTQLQPKMKELQKKYKHDKVKLNEEMMAMYRENGVSPLGGCIPMIIQFPVFIVLYEVINGLTNTYYAEPGHVLTAEPRYIGKTTAMYADLVSHPGVMKSFGINLADTVFSPNAFVDRIPFIVLILIAIGLQYFQMHQMTKRNGGNQTNPQMQAMQKFMPLIFAVIYIRISAGVNVYFVVSSLGRIGLQMWAFRSMPQASTARVGSLGQSKPGRKTLMERLAEAQQRALEQQRSLQQGGTGGDRTTGAGDRSGGRGAAPGLPAAGKAGGGQPGAGKGGGAAAGKAGGGQPAAGKAGGAAAGKAGGAASAPGGPARPRRPRPAGTGGGRPPAKPGSGAQGGSGTEGAGRQPGVNGRDRGAPPRTGPDEGPSPAKRTRKGS